MKLPQQRTPADIERDARMLLREAIKAGRLPRMPSLATLSRIAAIIGPVLSRSDSGHPPRRRKA